MNNSKDGQVEITIGEAEPEPAKRNHALTAALIGGAAAAATAGAVWSARALARRNGAEDGKSLNAVMKTACTATEVAHHRGATAPRSSLLRIPSGPKPETC